jgi:hypothetical protein
MISYKNLMSLAVAISVVGCGSTGGVLSLGPDTFTVSASKHYTSGGAEAKSNALIAANAHCAGLGKEILVTNISSGYAAPFYNSSVTFRCLNKKDAELARPNFQNVPDVVIEDRRR